MQQKKNKQSFSDFATEMMNVKKCFFEIKTNFTKPMPTTEFNEFLKIRISQQKWKQFIFLLKFFSRKLQTEGKWDPFGLGGGEK